MHQERDQKHAHTFKAGVISLNKHPLYLPIFNLEGISLAPVVTEDSGAVEC